MTTEGSSSRRWGGAAIAVVAIASVALLAWLATRDSSVGSARAADPPTVFAAASLTDVFPRIDPSPRFSFAGSNTLALQIRQGAPADVFASASPVYTQELFRDGLLERPVLLAENRLVVIVPRSDPAGIRSVRDVARAGVKLVVANPEVPVGGYTRTVLDRLGLTAALGNVVSEEADVRDVVGKVALGQADAGFAYATDVRATGSRLRTIEIPASAQPAVRYEIAVVHGAPHVAAARAFVARATGTAGHAAMTDAGFRIPVAP